MELARGLIQPRNSVLKNKLMKLKTKLTTSLLFTCAGLGVSAQSFAATVNNPPTISGIPSTSVKAGTAYSFIPMAQDVDVGDTLTFMISGKPMWATFDTTTGKLSGTPTGVNAKTYTGIVISVKDSKLAKASLPAFDLTVTNDAPVLTGEPAATVYTGQRYRFAPVATDANGDKLTFSMNKVPTWATFSKTTGVLTGIPTDADIGSISNLVISVSDGNKKTSLPAFGISISNPAPAISGTPSSNVRSGFTYRFQPIANDVNKPASGLVFSISGQPEWASFDKSTGKLEGIPVTDRTVNFDNIVVSVSDGRSTVNLPPFGVTVRSGTNYTSCVSETSTGTAFSCQLPANTGATFALNNPKQGMAIQPKTGILHWTPTSNQTGQHYVGVSITDSLETKQLTVPVNVTAGAVNLEGTYIAPDGSDTTGDGSASAPYGSIAKAASLATAGSTLYLRGGIYYNEEYGKSFANRTYGAFARITTKGTATSPITLRPYGNEYVKLVSDVTALQFTGAQYWIIEGLELEGTASHLTLQDAMNDWWSENSLKTTGRGISTNTSLNIIVRNNIIHDFAGAGVGNNGSDMIKVENNVIYHNGWWSSGGVHGVANSYLTTVAGNEGKEGLVMTGNLVFGNQSRLISHVFSKGNVDLAIDEGNGLHAQNNTKTFKGKARVEKNLLLFNGKAGFGVNTMNNITVRNNGFYQNAQVVNTGELTLQSSTGTVLDNNLFNPLSYRSTLKDSSNNYVQLNGDNLTTFGGDSSRVDASILRSVVFKNPEGLDFSPAVGIDASMGVPAADLQRMAQTVNEYGIRVQNPVFEAVDAAYLCSMKQQIFATWDTAVDSLKLITLTDRDDNMRVYHYEDRGLFSCTP